MKRCDYVSESPLLIFCIYTTLSHFFIMCIKYVLNNILQYFKYIHQFHYWKLKLLVVYIICTFPAKQVVVKFIR